MNDNQRNQLHTHKKAKHAKPPVFVYVMYFLVATLIFTGVTFSGYITVTNAEDMSRVARFEITESGLQEGGVQEMFITEDIIPGEDDTQELFITNKSEVAVNYTIRVEKITDNLPIGFNVGSKATAVQDAFEYTEVLEPNAPTKTYKLYISWPEDQNDPSYSGKVDLIKVTVSATQKD